MSFERPSLATLVARIQADFVSRLGLVGAVLRRAMVYVFARVLAGATHMLHGHLEFLSRQLFPDLSEEAYLIRQASLYGMAKTDPDQAWANVIFTGTNGTDVPEAAVMLRSDGAEYLVDAEVEITTLDPWAALTAYVEGVDIVRNSGKIYVCTTSGTSAASGGPTTTAADITDGSAHWAHVATGSAAIFGVVTSTLAGADLTLDPGVFLAFESPVAGVDSTAYVTESVQDGTDQETTEALRVRLLEHLAEPAHGGNDADYIAWAKEVGGVTRAWVTAQELGPGTVVVRFVRDEDASPIPDAGELAEVQAKLDLEAPAHATPTAFAPALLETDFEIELTPDTSTVRAAVEAELADLFLREGEPGGTILLSQITTAIGTAAGIEDFTLTDPIADVTHTTNQLPAVGTVTFL